MISAYARSRQPPEYDGKDGKSTGAEVMHSLPSFMPIIKMLPGLVLENSTYHVNAPLLTTDLKEVLAYSQRCDEVLLTDGKHAQSDPTVSPDIVTRLMGAQDGKSVVILSSLKRLRIDAASSELAYLWFCLVPTLQTLEIANITESRRITIAAFMKELVGRAPLLLDITFGPGRLIPAILDSATAFSHLLRLQLTDAAESLSFKFLKAVSTLPELQFFYLDAKTALYSCYNPADSNVKRSRELHTAEKPSSSFPRLTTLIVTGNILLLYDFVTHLHPSALVNISLTLTRKKGIIIPSHWETSFSNPTQTRSWPSDIFNPPAINASKCPALRRGNSYRCRGSTCEDDDSYVCSDCSKEREDRRRREKLIWVSQSALFASLVEQILQELETLQSMQLDLSESLVYARQGESPPEFPPETLLKILTSNIENFEIDRWTILKLDNVIRELPSSVTPRAMRSLHFPMNHAVNTTITPTTLAVITQKYPRLVELRCYVEFKGFSRAKGTTVSVSETQDQLKYLSVGSERSTEIPIEVRLTIAPYICFLYPNLEDIKTQEGYRSDDWKSIHDLVKMCQEVRKLEQNFQTSLVQLL